MASSSDVHHGKESAMSAEGEAVHNFSLAANSAASNDAAHAEATRPSSIAESTEDAVKKRLVCIDIQRGVTMAAMVIADVIGGIGYPRIDHCDWNGIHFADFVMPFFLFTSGVSGALALKGFEKNRMGVMKKVAWRCFQLFALGVILQGDEDHFANLKWNLSKLRFMGILQRIAVAYGIAAVVKIFVPVVESFNGRNGRLMMLDLWLFGHFAWHWLIVLAILLITLAIQQGVAVPREGCAAGDWMWQKGELPVPCNIAGYIDTLIMSARHCYGDTSDHKKGLGFDPEGLFTTLSCIFTMYAGMHVGQAHNLVGKIKPWRCVAHWLLMAFVMYVLALCIHPSIPFNKQMWSISYNFFMVGCACLSLACLRAVEVVAVWKDPAPRPLLNPGPEAPALDPQETTRWSKRQCLGQVAHYIGLGLGQVAHYIGLGLTPMRWLGTNALLFFVFSDSGGVGPTVIKSIYVKNFGSHTVHMTLVTWYQYTVLMQWFGFQCPGWTPKKNPDGPDDDDITPNKCTMIVAYTLSEVFLWCCICGVLFRKRIFWKL